VDVAMTVAGDVYVVDRDNHRIQELASDGTFKRKWGSEGSGSGQFLDPTGLAINSVSDIYVADAGNDRIQKFTLDGTFVREWGTTGSGNGEFNNPTRVAVNPDGNIYVTDTDNNRVQYFTSDGEFLGKFGVSGDGAGAFNSPQGIDIDDSGNIYVADTDNYRIQKFNANHEFVYEFGSAGAPLNYFGMRGSSVTANNHGPLDIAIDAEGRSYVLDGINNRIQVFGEGSEGEEHGKTFNQDSRCHYSKPEEITWVKLKPMEKNGVSGMYLTWTQYSADTINIKIDDGTGKYPWKITNTLNDGHEFLPNVFSSQNLTIQPINHCREGVYSKPISYSDYPYGWYNVK
jgi:sugar lactone lactonase YvrE